MNNMIRTRAKTNAIADLMRLSTKISSLVSSSFSLVIESYLLLINHSTNLIERCLIASLVCCIKRVNNLSNLLSRQLDVIDSTQWCLYVTIAVTHIDGVTYGFIVHRHNVSPLVDGVIATDDGTANRYHLIGYSCYVHSTIYADNKHSLLRFSN